MSYSADKLAKNLFVFVVPCAYSSKLAGLIKPPVSLKSGSLGQVGFAEKAAPNKSP